MTLATAVMAGMFIFLRFPDLETTAQGTYTVPAILVIIGVLIAGILYVSCIWWGMAVFSKASPHNKFTSVCHLRWVVATLVTVVASVVVFGVFTHLGTVPATAETTGDPTPPAPIGCTE